jgi:acetyl esterase
MLPPELARCGAFGFIISAAQLRSLLDGNPREQHLMANELDPEYQNAAALIREAGAAPGDPLTMPLTEARAAQERYFAFLAQNPPPVASTRNESIEGPAGRFGVRLYYPGAERNVPVIVFTRGGGWWAGSLDSHDRTMRLLASTSGFAVCGVDYHRAPEQRYPTQLNELLAAVRWLRSEGASLGVDAGRMVLVGESAGANLSLLAAVRLRSEAPKALKGLVLFYGNYAAPKATTRAYSRWVWSQYLGTDEIDEHSDAVPLEADVAGLPPCWLGIGDADPLLDDTLRMCEKLRFAKVRCHLKRYPGLPHGFVMLSRVFEPAANAVRDAAHAAKNFIQ